ncbi:tetratricopeptide repeat-containing glycosyltransferase family protein [Stieleria sp. JC731]|uniref:tetratricopeptide repeat protein n=1 Tax=Pirellulaceae TaxID=2691357 RepID=UPI001E40F239|nr:tetratricopeptide repeat-containing glycosyltransferase family protein [Stieleria sp. JC731]MCC9599283.1 tetratricopeptide repeat-containing glycosyltransferase family protein [Stieleria sp. JC731]
MPTVADVLSQGWKVHQSGKIDEALRVYQHVIKQAPRNPEAHVYLGIALFDQRRYQESVDSYRTAISLKEQFPIAWNNLGNSLRMVGDVEESDQCFSKALALDEKYLSVYKNRGTLWIWSGEIERGLAWYEKGLQIAPDDPELHRNLGVIYLLLGDFDRGWPEYRWRWKMAGMRRPGSPAPLWTGQPIEGRSILLYPEQGRGDEMNFIRVASMLAQAGASVVVQCAQAMIPLFTSVRGIQSLLPTGSQLPPVDYQASFIEAVDGWYQSTGELPLGHEFFHTYGNHQGYLNVSEPLVNYWHHWMEKHGLGKDHRKRIGIAWQGNPKHHADVYRSVPLEVLRPLAEDDNFHLISLQQGFGSEQVSQVDFGSKISQLPSDTDTSGGAFTDTAAVMKNIDAVVTTDTSLAHLAGSLGVPTMVMLGKVPDWRWLCEGDQTEWYPSLKLFRQKEMRDWAPVVNDVHQHLQSLEQKDD